MSENPGHVMTQLEEELSTNISTNNVAETLVQENNNEEIIKKNLNISSVSDTSSLLTFLPPVIDIRERSNKDRDLRQVRALKAKFDRLTSSTTRVREQLSLDHCLAIEKFANETMVFRVDIAELEKKVLILDQKIKCMKSTHSHAMNNEKMTAATKLKSVATKMKVRYFWK